MIDLVWRIPATAILGGVWVLAGPRHLENNVVRKALVLVDQDEIESPRTRFRLAFPLGSWADITWKEDATSDEKEAALERGFLSLLSRLRDEWEQEKR